MEIHNILTIILLLTIAYIDIKKWIIDPILCLILALGGAWNLLSTHSLIPSTALALCAIYCIWKAINWISLKFYGQAGIGAGDMKLMMASALHFPYPMVGTLFLITSTTAAAIALVLLTLKIKTKQDRIPFGPFIAFGWIVCMFIPS